MSRGVDLHLPRLPRQQLVEADLASWEVSYADGTILREAEGAIYRQIDRSRLAAFRIVRPGEVLLEAFPPPGATGWNLCYRRRSWGGGRTRRVIFVVGWAPMGPVIAVDLAAGTYRTEARFIPGDPDLDPPVPAPEEGERFTTVSDGMLLLK